jgi:hypothetical protein
MTDPKIRPERFVDESLDFVTIYDYSGKELTDDGTESNDRDVERRS